MQTTNIYEELQKRAEEGKIIRLGMIGFADFLPLLSFSLIESPVCSWSALRRSIRRAQ